MSWKTIVVGVDDTKASKRALDRVADIALVSKAKVVVTSVAPVLTGMAASHGLGPFYPADPPETHQIELLHARDFLTERNVETGLELGLVLRGTQVLIVDGVEHAMGPMHGYVLPGGVEHSAYCGPEGALVLDVFRPVREDYRERWHNG